MKVGRRRNSDWPRLSITTDRDGVPSFDAETEAMLDKAMRILKGSKKGEVREGG